MRGTVLGVGTVVLATASDSCGPNAQQTGALVLMVAPLVFLLALGLGAVLRAAWQRSKPDLPVKGRVHVIAFVVLLMGAVAAGAVAGAVRWLEISFVTFGSCYLAVFLLVWRVELSYSPARAATWAPIDALLIALPALPLVASSSPEPWQPIFTVWLFGGYFGVVPALLFVGLMIEAQVRGRRPQ